MLLAAMGILCDGFWERIEGGCFSRVQESVFVYLIPNAFGFLSDSTKDSFVDGMYVVGNMMNGGLFP